MNPSDHPQYYYPTDLEANLLSPNSNEPLHITQNRFQTDPNYYSDYQEQQNYNTQNNYENQNDDGDNNNNNPNGEQPQDDLYDGLKNSMKFNMLLLLVSFGKMTATTVILNNNDFVVELRTIWLMLVFFVDFLESIATILTIQLLYRSDHAVIRYPIVSESNQDIQNNASNAVDFTQNDQNNIANVDQSGLPTYAFESQQARNQPNTQEYILEQQSILAANIRVLELAREITKRRKAIESITNVSDTFYFILFMAGQLILMLNIERTSEDIESLMLTYIIMGYAYILAPLLLAILACLCFPVLLIVVFCFRTRSTQVAATKRVINKLPVVHYKDDLPGGKECAICMVEYNTDDRLIQLRCSPMHHFHVECIKQWLRVNGQCPVCRTRVDEKKEATNPADR